MHVKSTSWKKKHFIALLCVNVNFEDVNSQDMTNNLLLLSATKQQFCALQEVTNAVTKDGLLIND